MSALGPGPTITRIGACLAVAAALAAPAAASVAFTQQYLDLEAGSRFRVSFDVNGDNRVDAEASGPLSGRLDAEVRLSDTGPAPILQAFRLRRLTVKPPPQLELIGTGAAAGFHARLVRTSLHLGDGLGRTGTDAVVNTSSTPNTFGWSQPNDNVLAARGSLRTRGPGGELDELLDLSEADLLPVPLSGTWQALDLGTRSRVSLRYTGNHRLGTFLPITIFIDISIEASQPLVPPPAPTTYANWAAASGLSGPQADAGADPDHDHRPNLAEYADATNPSAAEPVSPSLGVEMRDQRPTFVFVRHDNRTDLVYRLEVSDDLAVWKPLAVAVPDADAGGVAGGQVVEESLLAPGVWKLAAQDPEWRLPGPRRFARLVYEQR
jgi:hypothetical protein